MEFFVSHPALVQREESNAVEQGGKPHHSSVLAQKDERVHRERSLGWYPCGNQPE